MSLPKEVGVQLGKWETPLNSGYTWEQKRSSPSKAWEQWGHPYEREEAGRPQQAGPWDRLRAHFPFLQPCP